MFHLTATLCESGGTPDVVVKSKDTFVLPIVPHPKVNFKVNCIEMSKT